MPPLPRCLDNRRLLLIAAAIIATLAFIASGVALAADPRAQADPPRAANQFHRLESTRYVIHTDLGPDIAREAALRLDRLAEVFEESAPLPAGEVKQKLPFYLYQNAADYDAAGGKPGTAGVFDGEQLMAVAVDGDGWATWHVVQHEAFHQYANAALEHDLPPWLNEGLAEYFGEAIFTGDGYITGLVPPERANQVRKAIRAKEYEPLRHLVRLTHDQWNDTFSPARYDHAWSLVHFLHENADPPGPEAVKACITALTSGADPAAAFEKAFGDASAIERQWKRWWLELPEEPTAEGYARATVAKLTSFLARATAAGQRFTSIDSFFDAALAGEIHVRENDWLPPSLLQSAMREKVPAERWAIEGDGHTPALVLTLKDGARLVGTFELKDRRVNKVSVEVK